MVFISLFFAVCFYVLWLTGVNKWLSVQTVSVNAKNNADKVDIGPFFKFTFHRG